MKRVEEKIVRGPDCWEWVGCHDAYGYGRVSVDSKNRLAHRVVYELYRGEVPEFLDHLCRNRGCVNPDHLEGVGLAENTRRGRSANREKTHCPKGHEYVPENTGLWGHQRVCRTCKRAAWHKWKASQN